MLSGESRNSRPLPSYLPRGSGPGELSFSQVRSTDQLPIYPSGHTGVVQTLAPWHKPSQPTPEAAAQPCAPAWQEAAAGAPAQGSAQRGPATAGETSTTRPFIFNLKQTQECGKGFLPLTNPSFLFSSLPPAPVLHPRPPSTATKA